jgi:phosphoribosylformylglycinamidine synthase
VGHCEETRFGGTQYAKVVLNQLWGLPPALDMDYEKHVQEAIREIVAADLAESAHDLSDGGLAVALAECSFGPEGVGASVDVKSELRPEWLVFHEGPSRVLISTAQPERIEAIATRHGVEAPRIGVTMKGRIRIGHNGVTLVDLDIGRLRGSWETALEHMLGR